ncbi:MAG: lysophospholipid acyltransferase family protein [Abditibacteriota bacterium]|nr:lysophospholipid acyltransferase family protein [Abditibacteriota bacterium]
MTYAQIHRRAKFLSRFYYMIDKRRMNIAKNNIKRAFGDLYSDKEVTEMVKEMLYNFVVEYYMFFAIDHKSKDEVKEMISFEHQEYLDEALSKNRGAIILTAHMGNWELLARRLCCDGLSLSVIARDSDHTGITTVTNKIRNNGGYSVYSKDRPVLGIVKALRKNELIGILPDQNNDDGIWVKFFGMPAKTAIGPAVISLKTGAPMLPACVIREDLGKYKLEMEPEIKFEPTGDKDKDIEALTQIVNDVLEKMIRKYPTSWLWVHDRWKKRKE